MSQNKRIGITVAVAMRGPIQEGRYFIGKKVIEVGYDTKFSFHGSILQLPRNGTTVFNVAWLDSDLKYEKLLKSPTAERFKPIEEAVQAINQLCEAFMLEDSFGSHKLRYIGTDDALLIGCFLGDECIETNLGLFLNSETYTGIAPDFDFYNSSEVSARSKELIDTDIMPIARRYLRCRQLVSHSYYSEAVIVFHSILDDNVQKCLNALMKEKGLDSEGARAQILRGIKEQRLSIYLGPMLKMLFGKSINELWEGADQAIKWFNTVRNKVAHNAYRCSVEEASLSLYVSMKVSAALAHHKLIEMKMPPSMFRDIRLKAAWSGAQQSWIPLDYEFDSHDEHSKPLP